MDKTERGTMLKKCALIVVGAVLYAAGMGLFLSPNHLAPGRRDRHRRHSQQRVRTADRYHGVCPEHTAVSDCDQGVRLPLFFATLAATTLASLLIDVFDALRSRRTTFCWPRLRAAR